MDERLVPASHDAGARGRSGAPLALLGYACLSAAIFGRQALGDIQHFVVGFGQTPAFYGRDQSAYVWFLAWGAHALAHLQNPFLTSEVYAPHGYNLAWAASILGPALLLAPLTTLIGAVAGFNLLAIAAPATAAWSAFMLCRHLTRRSSSALAGGLLFGFNSYETGEMVNHLNLALVGLLPLAVLLVLRRRAESIPRTRFVGGLEAVLALQLWTSTEVFASTVMFGAIAFAIALVLAGRNLRGVLWSLLAETAGASAVALTLGAPYLYYALVRANPLMGHYGVGAGADLANFVVPTRATWLHGQGRLAVAAQLLAGNLTEQLAYLGPALLALLGVFAVEFRSRLLGRCLVAFTLTAAVFSLGGQLILEGRDTGLALPWDLLGQLPLLDYALPGRFVLYIWLAAAVALACWLDRPRHRSVRWALACLAFLSLAPNVTGLPWGTRVDAPALMSSRSLARYVPAGSTVLALPFGSDGDSMYWQAQAGFRFRLAGGYVSWAVPRDYRSLTIIHELTGRPLGGRATERLCAFIALTGSRVILLRDRAPGHWHQLLDPLHVKAIHAGGFTIYELDRATCHRA